MASRIGLITVAGISISSRAVRASSIMVVISDSVFSNFARGIVAFVLFVICAVDRFILVPYKELKQHLLYHSPTDLS